MLTIPVETEREHGNLLLVLSLPPPATGQSIISAALRDCMSSTCRTRVVDTAKCSFRAGAGSIGRVFEVLRIIAEVARSTRWCDSAYLVLSQSVAGNIRDLVCLWLLRGKRIILHLHGGGIRQQLFERSRIVRWLNSLAYRRVERVIVLGESLRSQFAGVASEHRIVCVPNFAESVFFTTPEKIREKFRNGPMRIAFLSNMIREKGYMDLIMAIQSLTTEEQARVHVDLIGKFDTCAEEDRVRVIASSMPVISVHGSVEDSGRADLLKESHVFVLPTYYRFEGQPVSILEAYAAGCVVVTTLHNGILDIFVPQENGFAVQPRSPQSIAETLRKMLSDGVDRYLTVALRNQKAAARMYTRSRFCRDMSDALLS